MEQDKHLTLAVEALMQSVEAIDKQIETLQALKHKQQQRLLEIAAGHTIQPKGWFNKLVGWMQKHGL